MKKITELKQDWKWMKLGEACSFVGGGTPSKKINSYWNGSIFWASVKDIKGDFLNSTEDTITEYGLENSASNIAEPNDVILITRISPGKCIITNVRTAINQDLKIVKPKFETTSKFISYYFKSIERKLINNSSGTTVLGITLKSLNDITIPVLDIQIQNVIVSKIEELFSELDKGIENLRTAQQQLKTYRQSVLKWAFEGKLTNENVKEGVLLKGWKEVSIKDVTEMNPKIPNREDIDRQMEVQFLPMKLVEEINNKIHLTEIRKYEDVLKGSYTPFINGDVIFAKVTPCMENGKIAIVNSLKNGIGFGSSEFHVIRAAGKIIPEFIFYYLVQDRFRNEAANEMTGAVGLRRVPKQFIENHDIPLPSVEEQSKIVQEIESRLSVADKMEESITQSLQQAEALRQSILKKAFEGRLL